MSALMRPLRFVALALSMAVTSWACGKFGVEDPSAPTTPEPDADARAVVDAEQPTTYFPPPPVDGGSARCSPTGAFGPVSDFALPTTDHIIEGLRLSSDELTLYFWVDMAGPSAPDRDLDLFTARRASVTAAWGEPTRLAALNQAGTDDAFITLTSDEKTAFFHRGGVGARVLYVANREADGGFGQPQTVALPPETSSNPADDSSPWVSRDGGALFFASHGRSPHSTTNLDLFRTDFTAAAAFVALSTLSSPAYTDSYPVLTADELTVYFKSTRGTDENGDIYMAQRASAAIDFDSPLPIAELSTKDQDFPLWVSDDGCTLIYRNDHTIKVVHRGF